MDTIRYCTPQWLEECKKRYDENSALQAKLKKITRKMVFLVTADPAWGIGEDIYFCAFFDEGKLLKLELLSPRAAAAEADYILEATPREWVDILRKKTRFIARFMMQEIKLPQGEKIDVLSLAPYANDLVDVLALPELQYPDEMTPEQLEAYRADIHAFRSKMAI